MARHIAMALAPLLAAAVLAAEAEPARLEPPVNKCPCPLGRLEFRNRGLVTPEMRFVYLRRPCYYAEGLDRWSTPWGGGGSSSYRYLYRTIEPAKQPPAKRPPVVFEDFEKGTFKGWKVEGEAFGRAPSRAGAIHHHQPLRGWQGKHLADSFLNDGAATASAEESDRPQGKLTSRPFTIDRHAIGFLIGGGSHAGRTCVNLLVGGKVVRTAAGNNSEQLVPTRWDVRDLEGKQAVLQIVDAESGGWGHVMVDQIVLDDEVPPAVETPPTGMRSAVPLGGLGAGTIEMRADGSLRDWNIFNNSPAGGGQKVHLPYALFGLRVKPRGSQPAAWTLLTHPPEGLPPIGQIEYAGAFPVSRLCLADRRLPLAVDLYAYCNFHIRKPDASGMPAVLFTFCLHNPTDRAVDASLLFNLPNHIGGAYRSGKGLALIKDGTGPVSGSMAVRVAGDGQPPTFAAADEPAEIWHKFAASGTLDGSLSEPRSTAHGAIDTTLALQPGASGTVTFVLAWDFPHRPHGRQVVGNHYTQWFPGGADEVAQRAIDGLADTWQGIAQWHALCFDNTLPDWLQDALVNSPATMLKTGMWYADGRWRQWESFSCAAVDPIHIHFYRSLPYALFFPELERNLLLQYAAAQAPDGYIREHLADAGSPNAPGGRWMGDGCTTFLLDVTMTYLWSGDRTLLDSLWPHAKRAAQWQIQRSRKFGLPANLNNTYDWWGFEHKDVVAYNAVLHLAAVQAARRLAEIEGDKDFAAACERNFKASQRALQEKLWTGRYFRAWWMADGRQPDPLHADTLYGQLWAFLLGLGYTADPQQLRSHQAAEAKRNASPFGLKVMQGTGQDSRTRDELVWQAGSVDWAAMNLYLGGEPAASLPEAEEVINVWRCHLRDQWDWRDLTTAWDGLPWCNSHYARQLTMWAIPLALSGQQYSQPDGRLSFDPKVAAPARLPWFIPTANGTLEILDGGRYKLTVLSGRLEVDELSVGKAKPAGKLSLGPGQTREL